MGHLGSTFEQHIFPRESFSFKFSGLQTRCGKLACSTFKPSGEDWRTWFSKEQEGNSKLSARYSKFSSLQQSSRSSGFNSQNLQLDGRPTFGNSEVETSTCSVKEIFGSLGRAFWILGVGLSLSLPASAQTAATLTSEVPAVENATRSGDFMKLKNGNVDSVQPKSDASYERGVGNSAENFMSNDIDSSETIEDRLHLSEAFWRGIPIAEGSLLYKLKIQLDLNPSNAGALEALLQAVLEQQDMLRALTVLETLLELQPNNWEWKFLKARTHEFLGELLMAKQEYEELLNLCPLSARFLQGLVKLMNKVGQQTQALELIQSTLNQACSEGKDVEAGNLGVLLAQFYIQLGKFEDALQHLNSMTEQDPHDFRPYLCQGLVYALMNQMDKAKQTFEKYRQLCPSDALDQSYLDGLMLKAEANKRIDAFKRNAMKSTSRNRKNSKPMKQPSLFGNLNPHHEGVQDGT